MADRTSTVPRDEAGDVYAPLVSAPRIADLLRGPEPAFSFEFMPPKTPEAEVALRHLIRQVEHLRPAFVSVTYGAGGSTREGTLRTTDFITSETSLTPLAHLTAVDHSVADLRRILGFYLGAGVRNVLALRGDPPGDPQADWVQHPEGYAHADELVQLTRELGDFCVGVAAFPEKHPRSADADEDVETLARKLDLGAEFAITQMFFDPEKWLRLRDALAARGHTEPVVPEIMPVTSLGQVTRFAALCGAELPAHLVDRLHAAGSPAGVREVGVDFATEMAQRLLAEGAPGLHLITLNASTATREVHDRLVGVGV